MYIAYQIEPKENDNLIPQWYATMLLYGTVLLLLTLY